VLEFQNTLNITTILLLMINTTVGGLILAHDTEIKLTKASNV